MIRGALDFCSVSASTMRLLPLDSSFHNWLASTLRLLRPFIVSEQRPRLSAQPDGINISPLRMFSCVPRAPRTWFNPVLFRNKPSLPSRLLGSASTRPLFTTKTARYRIRITEAIRVTFPIGRTSLCHASPRLGRLPSHNRPHRECGGPDAYASEGVVRVLLRSIMMCRCDLVFRSTLHMPDFPFTTQTKADPTRNSEKRDIGFYRSKREVQ